MAKQGQEDMRVYVGTYTDGDSEGIYVYRLDGSSGALAYESKATGVENPSFLAIGPQGRFLYAVNEIEEFNGGPAGSVSAFSIEAHTGGLTFLNRRSTGGPGPCHLSIDRTGACVLAANYGGGSVSMLPIHHDGTLGDATGFIQHKGSSVDPERQEGPHAHSIVISPDNRCAFAPDLGLDEILIYKLDLTGGQLIPNDPPSVAVAAGAGPRHFDFHPDGKYAYVINEIGNTITAFGYDEARGALHAIETVPTLPDDFEGVSPTADIHVHRSGKILYGSNRGHDSIVIFRIDQDTGRLTYVDHASTRGQNPRNFAIDPTGSYLLAANQDTGNIVVFRIDEQTGRLTPTGHSADVPAPVCLKLIPVPTR